MGSSSTSSREGRTGEAMVGGLGIAMSENPSPTDSDSDNSRGGGGGGGGNLSQTSLLPNSQARPPVAHTNTRLFPMRSVVYPSSFTSTTTSTSKDSRKNGDTYSPPTAESATRFTSGSYSITPLPSHSPVAGQSNLPFSETGTGESKGAGTSSPALHAQSTAITGGGTHSATGSNGGSGSGGSVLTSRYTPIAGTGSGSGTVRQTSNASSSTGVVPPSTKVPTPAQITLSGVSERSDKAEHRQTTSRRTKSATARSSHSEDVPYGSNFDQIHDAFKPQSLDPYLPEPTTHAIKQKKLRDSRSSAQSVKKSNASLESDSIASKGIEAGKGKGRNLQETDDVAEPKDVRDVDTPEDGELEGPEQDEVGSSERMSAEAESDYHQMVMAARFDHQVSEDGVNWVITGRDGVLQRCEDEPIHAPGAIQAFGVLICLDEQDDGSLRVMQVSENCKFIIGITPAAMLSGRCFTAFLSEEEEDVLRDALDALDDRDEYEENTETGPMNFLLSGFGLPGTGGDGSQGGRTNAKLEWMAHAAIHRPNRSKNPKRVVLELEMVDDQLNPLRTIDAEPMQSDERGGMKPLNEVPDPVPSETDLLESTVNMIKPLRAMLRTKRRAETREQKTGKPSKAPAPLDVIGLLSQINDQLTKAEDLDTFLKVAVGIFKELTEFDRVMIYQFDENWNGRVVAELVDWTRTKDLFRGLNFPASDIPAQARELYKLNKVRLLYDRDQPTARMCCRSLNEVQQPLDMTYCHLRAMSPIHIKYLGNMGVRSSMSISITAFGNLWGLIALHTYGRYGHRVSFPVRQLCKLLCDSISKNIERLSYAMRLQARKLINTAPSAANPTGYIVAKAEDLLTLFDADFGCISIGEEAKILGPVHNSQELLAVLEYFRARKFQYTIGSHDITTDFPDLDYPAGFNLIAGLLFVPLSNEANDFIVFFRRGQVQEVHWAGNPYANKVASAGPDSYQPLEPRKSFKTWSEIVVGTCRAWTDEQLETAGVLCLVYGKFISVWREKQSALEASQLTSVLLANASHEVRTPLNAIINYLELALDGPVDGEVRENLARSHAASRSLVHVINDLLDLTRTETGKDLFLQEPFNLPQTIEEAISVHRVEANRRGLALDIVETPTGTPSTIIGDRGKVKQIVSNVVANAVKHTKSGSVLVEWGELADTDVSDALASKKEAIRIGISVTDTGAGISEEKLESLFREFEQVATIGEVNDANSSLGLGLAVVARIVRVLGGQLRVESKEEEGSKFQFILPFRLPANPMDVHNTPSGTNAWLSSQRPSAKARSESQKGSSANRNLGNGAQRRGAAALRRTNSGGSEGSLQSRVSSSKTEIDSLIEAITTSHIVSEEAVRAAAAGSSTSVASLDSITSNRSSRSMAKSPSLGEVELTDTGVNLRPVKVLPVMHSADAIVSNTLPRRNSRGESIAGSPAIGSNIPINHLQSAITHSQPNSPRQGKYKRSSAGPTISSMSFPGDVESPAKVSSRQNSDNNKLENVSNHEDIVASMRVLVVEDEMINRLILEKRLSQDGHEVVTCEHGGDALRLLEEDPHFDVCLMDLSMPILNGYDAAAGIRKLEESPDYTSARPSTILNGRLPILAVSAGLPERSRASIEKNFDGWMVKPVDNRRLRILMKGAIDAERRRREVYQPGAWEKGGWLVPAPSQPKRVA